MKENKEWSIQKYIKGQPHNSPLEYETLPEYSMMTRSEMRKILDELGSLHPSSEFRGHNVKNERPQK